MGDGRWGEWVVATHVGRFKCDNTLRARANARATETRGVYLEVGNTTGAELTTGTTNDDG